MRILFGVVLLGLGCGGDALLGVGKPCHNSTECAAGLLCDYGQTPPKCSPMDTVGRDMSRPPPDLLMVDMPATDDMPVVTDDMGMGDMATSTDDMTMTD